MQDLFTLIPAKTLWLLLKYYYPFIRKLERAHWFLLCRTSMRRIVWSDIFMINVAHFEKTFPLFWKLWNFKKLQSTQPEALFLYFCRQRVHEVTKHQKLSARGILKNKCSSNFKKSLIITGNLCKILNKLHGGV